MTINHNINDSRTFNLLVPSQLSRGLSWDYKERHWNASMSLQLPHIDAHIQVKKSLAHFNSFNRWMLAVWLECSFKSSWGRVYWRTNDTNKSLEWYPTIIVGVLWPRKCIGVLGLFHTLHKDISFLWMFHYCTNVPLNVVHSSDVTPGWCSLESACGGILSEMDSLSSAWFLMGTILQWWSLGSHHISIFPPSMGLKLWWDCVPAIVYDGVYTWYTSSIVLECSVYMWHTCDILKGLNKWVDLVHGKLSVFVKQEKKPERGLRLG